MKKIKNYCAIIVTLFSLNSLYSEIQNEYTLKDQRLYRPGDVINTIVLKNPNKEIIARFQQAKFYNEKHKAQFSRDQKYLLIIAAAWNFFYLPNPKIFEWHLFDLQAQKTIKKFPEKSYPKFDEKNQNKIILQDPPFEFIIPTEEPQGLFALLFSRIKDQFSWLFGTKKSNQSSDRSSEKELTLQEEKKTTPESPPLFTFVDPDPTENSQLQTKQSPFSLLKMNIPPESRNDRQQIIEANKPALIKSQPIPILMPQNLKQMIVKQSVLNPLKLLLKIALQPKNQQKDLLTQYLKNIQLHKGLYSNTAKSIIPAPESFKNQSYAAAVKQLKKIEELSEFMVDKDGVETINSPATVDDFIRQTSLFCWLFLNLSQSDQIVLLKKSLVLIKKYYSLYTSILNSFEQKQSTTLRTTKEKKNQANKLLNQIKEQSQRMKESDINSSTVVKEIFNLTTELDAIINKLPLKEKKYFDEEQQELVTQYRTTYINTISNLIAQGWKRHNNTIIKITTNLLLPALSAAILPGFQAATGNAPLNFNNLAISMFTYVASVNASEFTREHLQPPINTLLFSGGSAALDQMFTTYNQQTIPIPLISPAGILKGALLTTVATEAQNILALQGGVPHLLKLYSKTFVVRDTQPLVSTIEKNILRPDITELLGQIAYVTAQSAAVGMAMHFTGLGYSDETTTPDILYYSALRGIIQGSLGYVAHLTTEKTGALITAPTALISTGLINYLAKDSTLTPQAATTSILQATGQAAIDLVTDESKGFMNAIGKAQKTIGGVFTSWWSNVVDFTSTIAEGITEMNEEGIPVI